MAVRYRALRGTRDILPDEARRWQRLEAATRTVFRRYGFGEIRTPVFEATELFTRSVGTSTDIVRKEMYTLGSGEESITLRPEGTAPVARAVVEHSLHREIAAGFPERLYYIGPMFRHERPQKGRQRQFHQIGAEVLGAAEPLADAETIEMVWTLLDEVGIADKELRLSSVGDAGTRETYRAALLAWLAPHLPAMCDDCHRRAAENPLRVFDCKVDADRARLQDAPKLLDFLDGEAAAHFAEVRALLEGYGIPYVLDPRLVRGLDYYVRTVFEIVGGGLGAQNALLGGGRYDGLVEELGGPAVPGFGFAAGMERIVMTMPERTEREAGPAIAIIALGDAGFRRSIQLARDWRAQGISVLAPLSARPLGAQMKRAEKVHARFAVFVGDSELAKDSYGFKDLVSGNQIEMTIDLILSRVQAKES